MRGVDSYSSVLNNCLLFASYYTRVSHITFTTKIIESMFGSIYFIIYDRNIEWIEKLICLNLFVERADRIRRRAAAGSSQGPDGSEFSENSNTSSTLNDENRHPVDNNDIHQKGIY